MDKKEEAGEGKEKEKTPDKSAETKKADTPMIPKSRLDEIIKQRDEARAEVKATEKSQKDAQSAALAEQGKYKELYEQQVLEAEKAQAQVTSMQADSLKRDVASKAGHPQMWDRIEGKSQEELEVDMARLIEAFPKAQAPNIDAGTSSGKRTAEKSTKIKMSPAEREYLAGILNVQVEHLPQEI